MKRTEWLQETRKMRFEKAYEGYRSGSLTQAEATLLLGECDRTFWRYMNSDLMEWTPTILNGIKVPK